MVMFVEDCSCFNFKSDKTRTVALPTSEWPNTTIASSATLSIVAFVSSTSAAEAVITNSSSIPSISTMSSLEDRSMNGADTDSAISPSTGVTPIVTNTIAVKSPMTSFGNISIFSATANTTNANSPPPLNKIPMRKASTVGNRFGSTCFGTRVATINVNALTRISPAAPPNTVGHSLTTKSKSKFEPASIKKIPNKIPLNGRISAWICAL
mmetsp:Transcript_29957/g.72633  ORF Transcript_29957/g.72633 Transcript_29957/m.72633 type:complete len:210 (-) Transcript_29957:1704-2333(-)